MKAIRKEKEGFKGLIPDRETYEKVKHGTTDWKPHVKEQMVSVEIPYDLFVHLMKLDMAVETVAAKKKAEEEDNE